MLGRSAFRFPVQKQESDPTHNRVVSTLIAQLNAKPVVFRTNTFEGGVLGEQVLLGPLDTGEYEWWSDVTGNRIPVGNGRYIQPDICGRPKNQAAFCPSNDRPAVLIEVIQTHPPEWETLFYLLDLTEKNHLLVFYFVAPNRHGTKYSYANEAQGQFRVTSAFYLLDRKVFANGAPRNLPSAPRTLSEFRAWYKNFRATFLDDVMRLKNEIPPAK